MLRSSATLLAFVLLPLAACMRVDDDVRSDARVAVANVHVVRRTVEEGYNQRSASRAKTLRNGLAARATDITRLSTCGSASIGTVTPGSCSL